MLHVSTEYNITTKNMFFGKALTPKKSRAFKN